MFCIGVYFSFSQLDNNRRLAINVDTTGCKGTRNFIRYVEHVHVIISLVHSRRGQVSIYLVSPMKTRSRVLSRRKKDYKNGMFASWAFLSTHFWGENPMGQWKLEIHSKSFWKNDSLLYIWTRADFVAIANWHSKRLSLENKAKLFQLTRADFVTISELTH